MGFACGVLKIMQPEQVIDQQMRRYYAERAREYDRIYDKPERQKDLAWLRAWLPQQFSGRRVLEIAAGTGYWSQLIAPLAKGLTATDTSEEVLQIARSRLAGMNAATSLADAFALSASLGQFDAALAGHWISHVPLGRLDEFLVSLHGRLLPGAVVAFFDNRYVEGSSTPISERDTQGNSYQQRLLGDGTRHRVLKNFPDATALRRMVAGRARSAEVIESEYFWVLRYEAA